jgi:hypothetical protein
MLGLITWTGLLLVVLMYGAPIGLLLTSGLRPATVRISMWSGLLVLAVMSVILNFFIPLRSTTAMVVVVAVAIASAVFVLFLLRARFGGIRPQWSGWVALPKTGWFLVAALVVVCIWWLVAATRAPTNYDSGLYHLQGIWYAAEYPAIPGISNLYVAFGFANSLMPLSAIATNGPLGLDAYQVINGFIFLLLFIEVVVRLASCRRRAVGTKVLLIGLGVFVAPMIWMADYWVISPTFDTPVAILTLVSVAALADILTSARSRSVDIVAALIPISLASSMRQHYWFLFAFFVVIILWVVFRRKARGLGAPLWVSLGGSAVLLIVMLVRDYVLSGWLLYPYKIFSFNVDWVAPDPAGLIDSTKLWARSPTPEYQQLGDGWAWVRPWLGANLISWVFIAVLGCLILSAIAFLIARKFWRPRSLLVVMAPLVLYLITWFFVGAPQVRYSWVPLLMVGVLPLAWAWQAIDVYQGPRLRLLPVAQIMLGIELIIVVAVSLAVALPRLSSELPLVPVATVPLSPTVNLLIPQGTDQCWSNFPLCSGAPASGLALRGEAITQGFRHAPSS